MKIAIPNFGPRVSPRYDCATSLLLYTVEGAKVVGREEIALHPSAPWQRVDQLRDLGVQAVICGGIDGHSAGILKAHQIRVVSWVAGEAEGALRAFLRGDLRPGSLGLGCGRRRSRVRPPKF